MDPQPQQQQNQTKNNNTDTDDKIKQLIFAYQEILVSTAKLDDSKIIPNMHFNDAIENYLFTKVCVPRDHQMEYTYMQNAGMLLVTGIPGSGKTTLLKNIAKIYRNNGGEYEFLHIPFCNLVVSQGKIIQQIMQTYPQFNILQQLVRKYKNCQPVIVLDELDIYPGAQFTLQSVKKLMKIMPWVPIIGITSKPQHVNVQTWPQIDHIFNLEPPNVRERQQFMEKFIQQLMFHPSSIKYSHINYRFVAEQTINYTYSDLMIFMKHFSHELISSLLQNGCGLNELSDQMRRNVITQKNFNHALLSKKASFDEQYLVKFKEAVQNVQLQIMIKKCSMH